MRYAAKLLFIWNPDPVTGNRVRRLCEERILVFEARSSAEAVRKARSRGRDGALRFESGHRLDFGGVLQCMELASDDTSEVWWEFRRHANPERWAKKALPSPSELFVYADRARKNRAAEPEGPSTGGSTRGRSQPTRPVRCVSPGRARRR